MSKLIKTANNYIMILNIFLLLIGFILLTKCADFFIEGASDIAAYFHMSKTLIGLTIVSFGTSAPEFAISCNSIISGNGDIVLGNVIGSNILNIVFILGISTMFHFLNVKNNTVKKELPIVVLFSILLSLLLYDNIFDKNIVNILTKGDGILLVLFFLIFIYYLFSQIKNKTQDNISEKKHTLTIAIFLTAIGIFGIIYGSELVVKSASKIAINLGISERMIALTIVAFGTSLPEFVTTITATKKGMYDIAIGNVVGSNIFNIGMVLGIPIVLFGGITSYTINIVDLLVFLLSTLLLFFFALKKRKITKNEGFLFLTIFAIYYSYVIYMH